MHKRWTLIDKSTTISNKGIFIQMLKRHLNQLTQEFGWDPVARNDDGSYSLSLDPNLQIVLRENELRGITLLSSLASLPENGREEYLIRAMTANLFGAETGGAVLGLDREGKVIFLSTFLGENLSYRDFRERLEDFVNYAESWRNETLGFVPNKVN
ncbi:MAG: type III secretion system chaperone [Chlamydiia bacterium]|nr:type III secretion system chaperone [Chlamydiia bacterium]